MIDRLLKKQNQINFLPSCKIMIIIIKKYLDIDTKNGY